MPSFDLSTSIINLKLHNNSLRIVLLLCLPFLQRRNLKHKEVKELPQDH